MQAAIFVIKIWCGLTRGFKHLLVFFFFFFITTTCFPIRSHRGYITSPSSSRRPCRWTDEHRGEEEEEAAQEQDHLQQQPAPSPGASVREDALPRRLRPGGPGPPGQPHRGQGPGTSALHYYFTVSSRISTLTPPPPQIWDNFPFCQLFVKQWQSNQNLKFISTLTNHKQQNVLCLSQTDLLFKSLWSQWYDPIPFCPSINTHAHRAVMSLKGAVL